MILTWLLALSSEAGDHFSGLIAASVQNAHTVLLREKEGDHFWDFKID